MPDGLIGAHVIAPDAPRLLAEVERAERLGVPAVWLIGNPVDPVALLAAAAVRTERILLGTAIIRTWPRHPIVAAEEAAAIAGLAPGRFRLGVGPASRGIEEMYGIPYVRPLAHLRAYVKVLKGLLDEGAIDLDEAGIVAHHRLPTPPPHVPVLASALRRRSFEVCGEVTDGAITWLCPGSYVRDVGLPALRAGAERAGRPVPLLVMHVPACVLDDTAAVRQTARERFAFYVGRPHYQGMFEAAGFPEVRAEQWSDAMIDAVVVYGSEAAVADRLRGLLAMGVGELMVSPLGAGPDPAATIERTLRLVAALGQERS